MLLINHDETELLERNAFLNQRVRTDDGVDFAGSDGCAQALLVRRFERTGQKLDAIRA